MGAVCLCLLSFVYLDSVFAWPLHLTMSKCLKNNHDVWVTAGLAFSDDNDETELRPPKQGISHRQVFSLTGTGFTSQISYLSTDVSPKRPCARVEPEIPWNHFPLDDVMSNTPPLDPTYVRDIEDATGLPLKSMSSS
jgi:hypothetical protein